MNALAKEKVGKYLNTHFVSAFQKVATFQVAGKAKQGGNVASYFCTHDGLVLHAIAGPVDGDPGWSEDAGVDTRCRTFDAE